MSAGANASYELVEILPCVFSTYLKFLPTARIVTTNTIVVIFDMFLAVFTMITNSLFISTYRRTQGLQNTANMLLVVLAISDLLVGCLVEPLHITRAIMDINGSHLCILFDITRLVMILCSGLSFLTIIVITYDRYIAIFYPLRYAIWFSKARIKLVFIACGVVVVGLLAARALLKLKTFFLIICGLAFYTTISALIVYFKILLVAKRLKVRALKLRSKLHPEQSRRRGAIISLHEIKTTSVMAYVLGAMILCYFPGTCFWIYSNYHGYTKESLYSVVPLLETALFMNSAINPVVYILRSRQIRSAFIRNIRSISRATNFIK